MTITGNLYGTKLYKTSTKIFGSGGGSGGGFLNPGGTRDYANLSNPDKKFGIREVANVVFKKYVIIPGGYRYEPVCYFDSLRITTLETTIQTNHAVGGLGAPERISWESNKEVKYNIQDALISTQSLAMLSGSNYEKGIDVDVDPDKITILSNKFGAYYRVEAEGLWRGGADGFDIPVIYEFPKVRIIEEFTIKGEMDGDPSVFDFKIEVYPDNQKRLVIMSVLHSDI